MKTTTTIPVSAQTREKLKLIGHKGETYEQIILKLIKKAEYEEFLKRQYKRLKEEDNFVPLDEL